MSGQIAASSTLSVDLVILIVGIAMLVGAVDLIRQPGWAWKEIGESKPAHLILVLLLPMIGLALYVFRARPKLVSLVAAGQPVGGSLEQPVEGTQLMTSGETMSVVADLGLTPPMAEVPSAPLPASVANVPAPMPVAQAPAPTPAASPGFAFPPTPTPVVAPAPVVVPAPMSAAASASPGFGSFGEVATFNEYPPASGGGTSPESSAEPGPVEISSTFFSSGDTNTRSARHQLSVIRSYRPKQRTSLPTPEQETPTIPAGWKADPAGRHQYRYWDGFHWTENVADAGQQSRDSVS